MKSKLRTSNDVVQAILMGQKDSNEMRKLKLENMKDKTLLKFDRKNLSPISVYAMVYPKDSDYTRRRDLDVIDISNYYNLQNRRVLGNFNKK